MMAELNLDLILAKDAGGDMRMWACRGEGKGCERNRFLRRKKPCDDCMGPLDESLTLEQVEVMLKKGDA